MQRRTAGVGQRIERSSQAPQFHGYSVTDSTSACKPGGAGEYPPVPLSTAAQGGLPAARSVRHYRARPARRNVARCFIPRTAARQSVAALPHASRCPRTRFASSACSRSRSTIARRYSPNASSCTRSSPKADVDTGRAQSRRERWRGEPSPSADVAGASPVPAQMWAGASPVPAQMWAGASPVPAQMPDSHPNICLPCRRAAAPSAPSAALGVRRSERPSLRRSARRRVWRGRQRAARPTRPRDQTSLSLSAGARRRAASHCMARRGEALHRTAPAVTAPTARRAQPAAGNLSVGTGGTAV